MSLGGPRGFSSNKSSHNFAQVPSADIPRSSFDRSRTYRTTCLSSSLVPIYYDEALPGDTVNLNMSTFARLTTPIKPIFDNIFADYFFFAVPFRILWENWEKFNGAQTNPGDSTDYLVPQIASPPGTGIELNTLGDYFGLPLQDAINGGRIFHFNAWAFRAYNMIYNEWFRDQNLEDSVPQHVDDGPDPYTDYVLQSRNTSHDYFTSALPFTQKGPAVTIPLGSSAPVVSTGVATEWQTVLTGHTGFISAQASSNNTPLYMAGTGYSANEQFEYVSGLEADLSSATAATINELRQAFQIQRLYERDARGGTRYVEILLAHFGVRSPDYRLQRPEYLGGGRTKINVYPLAQTSASVTGDTPQGNVAAYGVHSSSGLGFNKSFTEHMVIIGLANFTSNRSYQQGLDRKWTRQTRFDYYWPALSHLGEQAILNQELVLQGTSADLDVFGYQERYAEYRYALNIITGEFRSAATDPLDFWHLAPYYLSLPTLSSAFISDPTVTTLARCLAVDDEPQIYFDAYFKETWARPMPTYSVPGLIDHF